MNGIETRTEKEIEEENKKILEETKDVGERFKTLEKEFHEAMNRLKEAGIEPIKIVGVTTQSICIPCGQ